MCRFEEATYRTTRWIDRCIKAHSRPTEQNLFAIVQGGLDPRLRAISIKVHLLVCLCFCPPVCLSATVQLVRAA